MSVNTTGGSATQHMIGQYKSSVRPISIVPWVRNPSWPVCEAPSGSNKVVGLYAVWPGDGTGNGGNFFAMTNAGAYTINYGDGTTTNYATGVTAYYEFNYNNANLAGTNAPVTFTDAGDLVTRAAHGYTDGMIVRFYNIVSTTGIIEAQQYFVINSTTNTFQVSETLGGSAVALTTNGSAALLPYKIATVTITPQAGNNLTTISFNVKHNQTDLVTLYCTGWLDIAIAAPSCTSIIIGAGSSTVLQGYLEQVKLNQLGNITSLASLFPNCRVLGNVVIASTITTLTDVSSMFFACSSLVTAPFFNTSAVTNMNSMFSGCGSLSSVPLYDTALVTVMSSMFSACSSLTSVPLFNTGRVTNMTSMFSSCYSLTSVPLLDTASVTTMNLMFSGCRSLISVPLFNTASVTTMASMFTNCYSLISVSLFDTVSVTTMVSMFQNCYSLTSVPLFNTILVNNMQSMFNGCRSLTSVPLFNTAVVTTMVSMFQSCVRLTTVPLFNTVKVNSMSTMFASCGKLTTVPIFNTIAVTNMNNMFNSCGNLSIVPLFNTATVTDMNLMFTQCNSLTSVPALVTTAVTSSANLSGMFSNCSSLARIQAKNFNFTFSVANGKLSATALDEIYTNLPTVTAQTITVTGNYGIATDNPAIATAKGWAVTG